MFEKNYENKLKIVKAFVDKLDPNQSGMSKDVKYSLLDCLYLFFHLYRRHSRKNRRVTKKQLSSLAETLSYSVTNKHVINVGNRFGVSLLEYDIEELNALSYFEENLMDKEIQDKYGNNFVFPEKCFRHVYKNYNDKNNNHEMRTQYYMSERGRRLSLIMPIILNTTEIYKHVTLSKYMHTALIRLQSANNVYYFRQVVISEWNKKTKSLDLVTSYPIYKEGLFINKFDQFRPLRSSIISQ